MKKAKMRKILNQKENMKKVKMRKILNQKRNIKKTNMRKILNRKNKVAKKMYKKSKKCLSKVEKFCQQIRQGPYFIFTVCHWCLYKRSVRLFEHQKYNILTAELDPLVRSFDEKHDICDHVIIT